MNIKPPMWASSPSQVSPEWRWFWESLEIGTVFWDNYTVFGKRVNLGTISTGAGVIGRRLTSFGDAIDFSGSAETGLLHDIVDETDFAKNPHTHIVTFLSDNDLDDVIIGMGSTNQFPASFIRLNADSVADQHEFFLRGLDTIVHRSRISSLDLDDGKVHVAVARFDGSDIELKIDNYSETSTDGPRPVDLSNTTLNTRYWSTGYFQRGLGNFHYNGAVLCAYTLDISVTDSQREALINDPFGPFRQANRLFLPDRPRSFGSVVAPSDTQRQPITVKSSGQTDINISQPPQIITNGGFDTDTNWTKGAGWTISGGVGVATSVANQLLIYQNIGAQGSHTNKKYRVRFEITSYTEGSVRPYVAGQQGSDVSAVGVYEQIVTAGTTAAFGLITVGTTTLQVDNISAREVDIFTITP